MSETVLTKKIKLALYRHTRSHLLGVYGAFEVACGSTLGYGKEFVDFMTMDAENVFRCYEIKISKADLHSPAAWSFYGDYNYLVVPNSLEEDAVNFLQMMYETRVGILVAVPDDGNIRFRIRKKATKIRIGIDQRIANMHNMVRSASRYTTKWVNAQEKEEDDGRLFAQDNE